jgi:hypothetical protein
MATAAGGERTRQPLTGRTTFAGAALLALGCVNLIMGFTAVHNSGYVSKHLVYTSIRFWGWTLVVWGALQLLAGGGTLAHRMWGRRLGMVIAGTSTVLWFFLLFSAPFAALVGVGMSIAVLIGLMAGLDPDRFD